LNPTDFTAQLTADGISNVVTVERDPNGFVDEHSHPFASRALILEGEITLVVRGQETVYRTGDVFQLAAGESHTERYGPSGVRYLVGRK